MSSSFRMIDVGDKAVTHRVAIARGEIRLSQKVCEAILNKRIPKGDVLGLAEVAGINGAKKTSELLPLCHPLPIDAVRIECELDNVRSVVSVRSTVSTHGRTGVEMEALSAVSAALLCIYDLTKSLDKGAELSGIVLEHKRGGKSGDWTNAQPPREFASVAEPSAKGTSANTSAAAWTGLRATVITASDRCSRSEAEDLSGKIIRQFLGDQKVSECHYSLVPDDIRAIQSAIKKAVEELECDLVVITGGTGLGPRDVTPEALNDLWTKRLPGFGEQFRRAGLANTPRALLSRSEAGLIGRALVVSLPGSPGGVRDGLLILAESVPHILAVRDGGGH